jgi:hypothetical protein
MVTEPDWKKAQNKVANALKAFELTRKDFWPRRFTDTYEARGEVVQRQPSDQWVLWNGIFYLVEVKSSNYEDKFYFKDVRTSQFIGARRSTAAGGRSVFVIVKLPEWKWHKVQGMTLWTMKEAGEKGILWSQMDVIQLTAEEILR